MGAKPHIVPFAPPPKRPTADVSGAPASVTEAERAVIRMLARRAARKWLAEATHVAISPESDRR